MEEMCKQSPACGIGSDRRKSCVMGREPMNETFFGLRNSPLGNGLGFYPSIPLCKALSMDYSNKSINIVSTFELVIQLRSNNMASKANEYMKRSINFLTHVQRYSDCLEEMIRHYEIKPGAQVFPRDNVLELLYHKNENALMLQSFSEHFQHVVSKDGTINFHMLKFLFMESVKLIYLEGNRESQLKIIDRVMEPFIKGDLFNPDQSKNPESDST